MKASDGSRVLRVKLTADEVAQVCQKADTLGMEAAEYMKELALGHIHEVPLTMEDYLTIRCAENVTSLSPGVLPIELRAVAGEVRRSIEEKRGDLPDLLPVFRRLCVGNEILSGHHGYCGPRTHWEVFHTARPEGPPGRPPAAPQSSV